VLRLINAFVYFLRETLYFTNPIGSPLEAETPTLRKVRRQQQHNLAGAASLQHQGRSEVTMRRQGDLSQGGDQRCLIDPVSNTGMVKKALSSLMHFINAP
jgi:hypothetical protein